ncbi:invasion associated locus B family protein [Bradyrhizobium genosp. L]|uniref:invasion associated locus B family protein n=1 Tax=Bradyrhizobium genosp. L TaxID=83637 RepID=UPI0018A30972|nr:invasion associated locus B family protein [Bradyrhizobium genosp. L]QPF87509.1 invasion associated locus B family protein [Bradyrhizobium genosp. L]
MKIAARSLVVLLAALATPGVGHSQAPKGKTAPPPASSPPAPHADAAAPAGNNAGWVARCTSASRDAPLECAMEQTAVLSKTGQLVVLVNIRVPGDTRTPVALIQLPLGLNLPSGAKLQVDDGKTVDVPIQTCEARGCYINAPVGADVLAQLKSGKQLKVSFLNLAKETITIPMPLADFAAVYEKIK